MQLRHCLVSPPLDFRLSRTCFWLSDSWLDLNDQTSREGFGFLWFAFLWLSNRRFFETTRIFFRRLQLLWDDLNFLKTTLTSSRPVQLSLKRPRLSGKGAIYFSPSWVKLRITSNAPRRQRYGDSCQPACPPCASFFLIINKGEAKKGKLYEDLWGEVVWVWLMRAVRAYGEGWCVYRIAGGVSASATQTSLTQSENLHLKFTNEPSIFVDGDMAESIQRSASDRPGDLVSQVRARTSPGFFTAWPF